MKELYIINGQSRSINYGIGTYTDQLVEVLKSLDFNIHIVMLYAEVTHFSIEQKQDYQLINMPKTRQYIKTEHAEERYLISVFYLLHPLIKDAGTIFHFNFLNMSVLGRLLKENFMCKIILTVHYMDWSFTLLGNKRKLKNILTGTNDIFERKIKEVFDKEKCFMNELSDHIIAISKHSLKTIETIYKISSTKITLISNGIKDEFIERTKNEKQDIRKEFYLSPKEFVIIFAGRIDPVKGVNHLIDGVELLLEKKTNIRLFIIGDGSISELASKSFAFSSKVSFTGFLSKDKLHKLYSIADIGVVPSLHEEFGLVAVEMLMYKIPIIVNKTTGLEEIVKAGHNGEYIIIDDKKKEKTANEVCDTLFKLIQKPQLRKRYIEVGRKVYLSKYSLDVFKKNINDFYSKI